MVTKSEGHKAFLLELQIGTLQDEENGHLGHEGTTVS